MSYAWEGAEGKGKGLRNQGLSLDPERSKRFQPCDCAIWRVGKNLRIAFEPISQVPRLSAPKQVRQTNGNHDHPLSIERKAGFPFGVHSILVGREPCRGHSSIPCLSHQQDQG